MSDIPRPPAIPYSAVGSAPRRAPEFERGKMAMALTGYLTGVLESWPVPQVFRDGLMARVNNVRRSQGLPSIELTTPTSEDEALCKTVHDIDRIGAAE